MIATRDNGCGRVYDDSEGMDNELTPDQTSECFDDSTVSLTGQRALLDLRFYPK